MAAHASQFDVALIPEGPYEETLSLMQLGEELGYRGVWLTDQGFHRDPFVLLGAAALRTSRVQLGLGVTSPFTRLPVQIARGAAAIDEIAGGRFKLGLGLANVANVLTPLGIQPTKPVQRLRDTIQIIRALLRGEAVTFDSPEITMRNVKLDFAPLRSEVPIYLGTRGPETLALAAEVADGVLIESLFNAAGLPYAFQNLKRGAARSGRDLATFDAVSWQMIQVTDNVSAALAAQRAWVARKIRVGPAHALELIGIAPAIIQRVNDHLAKGNREAAAAEVTDETVRCLLIIGPPDDVAARVSQMFRAGMSSVTLVVLGPTAERRITLERFAREVLPMIDA